jgi:hypothetical protein
MQWRWNWTWFLKEPKLWFSKFLKKRLEPQVLKNQRSSGKTGPAGPSETLKNFITGNEGSLYSQEPDNTAHNRACAPIAASEIRVSQGSRRK